VVAQVERDERDARLDQPPRQQRLLAPQMRAVAVAHRFRLLGQVERSLNPPADQHIDRLLLYLERAIAAIERPSRPCPQPVELASKARRSYSRSLVRPAGSSNICAAGNLPGVLTHPTLSYTGSGPPRWR
jgi:hypothetical protein